MVANELRIGNWVKIKEEFSSDRDFPLETLEFQIEGFNDGSDRYEEGAKQILFWNIKNKVFGTTTSGRLHLPEYKLCARFTMAVMVFPTPTSKAFIPEPMASINATP